jgi:serine-type D-Ala-D-Ala carboxypeptidase/endopeptidase
MKRVLVAATALALAAVPALAQEAAMPSNGEISQILADRIDRDKANIGIAVAVIEGGETRFVSHGTLGRDDPAPVNEFTPFEAGSVTKVLTSLVLAQLALEGEIDLDAPIADYLPEGTVVPEADGKAISAFDLATHMSGLTGLPEEITAKGLDNPYSGFTDAQLLEWLGQQQLARPIGEGFEYSNVGVALLGEIIEGVTDEPFAKTVEQRVLLPLGMESSVLALGSEKPEGMAIGHDGAGEPVPYWDFDAVAPAGALISTASDLAKFIAAASGASESKLKPAFDKMLERVRPTGDAGSVGLGWFVTPTGSGEFVWHNGRTGGFRAFAGFERTSGNGVVVLSNMSTEAGIEDIGMHLLDPSLPLRVQPVPRTAVEIDPAVLPGYAGDYVLAPGVVLSVTTEDGRLFAQLTGQQRFEIFPESETEFFYRVVEAQISFVTAADGTVSIVLHQNGQDMPGLRAE